MKKLICAALVAAAVVYLYDSKPAVADPTPIIVDGLCVSPVTGYVYGPPPCSQYTG